MRKKFLRRIWNRYSKLGRKRKKKQKWRKPKGRDNKMREKRRGYPAVVSIGYRSPKNERDKIHGKEISVVYTIDEMKKANSEEKIIVLGKLGSKRKIELADYAIENKIKITNLNVNKFLKNNKLKGKKNGFK